MKKSNLGQFNTKNDVWLRPHVVDFIRHSGCVYALDPFAGAGDLLEAARGLKFKQVSGYDIDIEINKEHGWWYNDSLKEAPTEPMGTIVITNPPYLAKNSANRNEYDGYSYFDGNSYEDLYQLALEKVFAKYKYSVFIIPETYFLTDLFKEYLDNITILEDNPFEDTDCPVCVACFNVRQDFLSFSQNEYKIYKNNNLLFTNHELHNIVLDYDSRVNHAVFFNDANGVLGLRGVDGTNPEDRIRFCRVEDLGYDLEDIKESSRAITTIYIPEFKITDKFLTLANEFLEDLRRETHDLVLSPFKNNNKIGKRRRRLDYGLARKLINKTLEALTNGN